MPAHNSGGGLELLCSGGVDDQHNATVEDLALGPLMHVGFVSLPEQSCQPAHTTAGSQPRQQSRCGRSANRRQDGAHTPGPSPEAVKFLLDERDMHGFGVESINIDAGQGRKFTPPNPAHSLILGRGRYGLQCLCNLDQLPSTGAVLVAAPLKIKQGSGSPLRVLAIVP